MTTNLDDDQIANYVSSLNGKAWGIALGLLFGFGLMFATIFLVLKGGENVGQHLGLLSNYFPGYGVTIPRSFIGFVYAFVVGYATGRAICLFYNLAARKS